MSELTAHYTVREAATLLGITYDAMRMRVSRDMIPSVRCGGRICIPKREFWRDCTQKEADGLIDLMDVPPEYKAERRLFLGDITFDHNILHGKRGVR